MAPSGLLAHLRSLVRDAALLLEAAAPGAGTRILELEARLASDDLLAVQWALSEATGGAGSLNDQVLMPPGGEADVRLRLLIQQIAQTARRILES